MFYFFYLEIALKSENDLNVYAYENISHIPTDKLLEIFKINLKKDPQIVEGYSLTKTNFKKHKKYIIENIGQINLELFEYTLHQYATQDFLQVRKMYKENLME